MLNSIRISCATLAFIVLGCGGGGTGPAARWNADAYGVVHDAAGVPVGNTPVRVSCPASTQIAATSTSASGEYRTFLELSEAVLTADKRISCRFEAPAVPSGAVARTFEVQFYPPASPHANVQVDIP